MNNKNTEFLIKSYPNLYGSVQEELDKLNNNQPFYAIAFGFECGDGWFNLLNKLSAKIEAMILAMPEAERGYYKAQQVKEKFGGLRFYMSSSTDEMEEAIRLAEDESYVTCEVSGKPGLLLTKGWCMVRSEEEAIKIGRGDEWVATFKKRNLKDEDQEEK